MERLAHKMRGRPKKERGDHGRGQLVRHRNCPVPIFGKHHAQPNPTETRKREKAQTQNANTHRMGRKEKIWKMVGMLGWGYGRGSQKRIGTTT